jgi:uncharacterized protein YjbI with pentapeptide repeats
MRITTPSFASLLMRPFGVAGENRLGISLVSAWTLAGSPLSVQDLWRRFIAGAGAETILDAAIPKSRAEYLVAGCAHAASPVTHLAVTVEVGKHRKVLNVVGDRYWLNGVPTQPEPFTTMPLDWRHAFGGDGFAENPTGKGYVVGFADGTPLPNVELPGRMIESPRARPQPASFGPFGIEWPQRTRGLGTYDQRWLEHDFPGFARDIDWRVHNAAPEDQHFEQPFAPGERIVLHNLVAGQPRVELAIPSVAGRCFVYRDEHARDLREVSVTLRTLWLVPDQDLMVLVFQGSEPISGMLGSEIRGVLAGLDAADRRREQEHFARALTARLDPELGAAELLDDRPLMPEGMRFPDFEERAEDLSLPSRTGAREANLCAGAELRRQEALRLFAAAGFEGGEALFPPQRPPVPSKKPLAEQVREATEEANRQQRDAEAKLAKVREQALEEMKRLGADTSFLDGPRPGPPPVLASVHLSMLQEIVREARASGVPIDVYERQLDDPELHRELFEQEARGREAYRRTAHRTEGDPELSFDRMASLRAEVEEAIRNRTSLSQADLTGAELGELDLSDMDLTGAWLEGANLAGANLTNARLDRAVLAKANLGEAVLRGTSLRGCNLGKARLVWTALECCDLERAILERADLRGAVLTRCNARGVEMSDARFESTRFLECVLAEVTFLKTTLVGASFSGCSLDDANFIEVVLDGVVFERCRAAKAAFVTCSGVGANFSDAILENARFALDCRFDEADFRRADLRKSTLRGCSFARARFDEGKVDGADLSQATLVGASFHRAELRRVLAIGCDLRGAVLRAANLMQAVLLESDIRGADIRGANLFGADLALVHADGGTRLDGALVTRVRQRPLRKETSS